MRTLLLAPGCLMGGFLLLFILLSPFIMLDLTASALAKLQLDPHWIGPVIVSILLGSVVNIPLWSRTVERATWVPARGVFGVPFVQRNQFLQIVALNVGGGAIPALLALYEISVVSQRGGPAGLLGWLTTLAGVTVCAHWCSDLIPGQGVAMRPLWPALTAAVLAMILTPTAAPACAWSAGVLGVILGADLSRLPQALQGEMGVVSIGGAGTFDGILMTGILSVFLA